MSNCAVSSRNGTAIQLWQFLADLLLDEKNTNLIQWTAKIGEFRLIDPDRVSQLWGMRKNHRNMNYEKLSRGLRYYYSKHILQKVPQIPYGYRFEQLPPKYWEVIVRHFSQPRANVVPFSRWNSTTKTQHLSQSSFEEPDHRFSPVDETEVEPLPVVKIEEPADVLPPEPKRRTPELDPSPGVEQEEGDVLPAAPKRRKITAVEAVEKCLENMLERKSDSRDWRDQEEEWRKIDFSESNLVEVFSHGNFQIILLEKNAT